jgi:NTE family protein
MRYLYRYTGLIFDITLHWFIVFTSIMRPLTGILLASLLFLTGCTAPFTRSTDSTVPVKTTDTAPSHPELVGKEVVLTGKEPGFDVKPPAQRPKIALVLGGGAARGFAHVGVIKVLEAQGIIPDMVVGTSAGSLVGALYAAGNNGFALQKIAFAMDEATISDWSVPLFSKLSGVIKGEAVQAYVNKAVHQTPIEKFKIPFGAVATDLKTGQPILFRRGNAGMAVRASSAVPGVFQPVNIGGRDYVDGGLVAPVPVHFAREMGADFVIAVNISAQPEAQKSSSSVEVLLQTFAIMGQTINRYELQAADIVIEPGLSTMRGSDFAGRNTAILAGERAASQALPDIRRKLGRAAP